jgi:hypothetical protein
MFLDSPFNPTKFDGVPQCGKNQAIPSNYTQKYMQKMSRNSRKTPIVNYFKVLLAECNSLINKRMRGIWCYDQM